MGVVLNWSSVYTGAPASPIDSFPLVVDGVHDVMASHVMSLGTSLVAVETAQQGILTTLSSLSPLVIQDNAVPVSLTTQVLNFVGTGVTLTPAGNTVTVDISGGGGSTLDAAINFATPDNDVVVPSTHPLILRDGGVAFDVLSIVRSGMAGGNGIDISLGGSTAGAALRMSTPSAELLFRPEALTYTGTSPFSISVSPADWDLPGQNFTLNAGDGGPTLTTDAGDGGSFSISAGDGGAGDPGTGEGGDGGTLTLTAGDGGDAPGIGGQGGVGGTVNILAGAGATGSDGGDLNITAGVSGVPGMAGTSGGTVTVLGGAGANVIAGPSGAGGDALFLGGNAGTGGNGNIGGSVYVRSGSGIIHGTVFVNSLNSGDIPFNETGNVTLDVGFSATSIIGALNELLNATPVLSLDAVINAASPDNDVNVPSANPVILRDGGTGAFDVLTVSRTTNSTGNGVNINMHQTSGGSGHGLSINMGTLGSGQAINIVGSNGGSNSNVRIDATNTAGAGYLVDDNTLNRSIRLNANGLTGSGSSASIGSGGVLAIATATQTTTGAGPRALEVYAGDGGPGTGMAPSGPGGSVRISAGRPGDNFGGGVGAEGELIFRARGSSLQFNETGHANLDASFDAISVVGAFNEVSNWTPEAVRVCAGMDDFDYGSVILADIWDVTVANDGDVVTQGHTSHGGGGYAILSVTDTSNGSARITRQQGPSVFSVLNPTLEFRVVPPAGEADFRIGLSNLAQSIFVIFAGSWSGAAYTYNFAMFDTLGSDIESVTPPALAAGESWIVQIRHVEHGAELWMGVQDGPLSLEASINYTLEQSGPRYPFLAIDNNADEIPAFETREMEVDYVRWILDRFVTP